MRLFKNITSKKPPHHDRLCFKDSGHTFRDALVAKRTLLELSPGQIQYAIFGYLPDWVNSLMALRNRLVKVFGFEVGQNSMLPASTDLKVGDQAGFLTVIECYPDEIISIADDKHMTFYLSVALKDDTFIISSLVIQKTWTARVYVNAILPFHYFIARLVINNAIKAKRV